jgi:hypothetical protein
MARAEASRVAVGSRASGLRVSRYRCVSSRYLSQEFLYPVHDIGCEAGVNLNRKTAQALGITCPPTHLFRAHEALQCTCHSPEPLRGKYKINGRILLANPQVPKLVGPTCLLGRQKS